MATLNQSLSVNGQQLSNKDPDLVITLDNHPVVQILSIQEASITYAFLSDVSQETIYNLNLTFLYKGTHKAVIPLQFTHRPEPAVIVTSSPDTANAKAGKNTVITVTVKQSRNGVDTLVKDLQVSNLVVDPANVVELVDGPTVTGDGVFTYTVTGKDSPNKFTTTGTLKRGTKTIGNLSIEKSMVLTNPTLSDLVSPMKMNLWDAMALSFKVMLDGTDITSSITDIVSTNPDDISGKFEFVKLSDTSWGYKSTKSDTAAEVTATGKFNVKVTYQNVMYTVSGSVDLVTNVNDGSIPVNRFDVEIL